MKKSKPRKVKPSDAHVRELAALLLVSTITFALLSLLILPVPVAADTSSQGSTPNPLAGVFSGLANAIVNGIINSLLATISALTTAASKGVEQGLSAAIKWIASLLCHVDRPASFEPVKDLWRACFKIYVTELLPISFAFLGIYVMFSSEPPNRTLFEGYIKRIAEATLIAYFSFPIIDTLVWLTNSISQEILNQTVGGLGNVIAVSGEWSIAGLAAIAAVLATGGLVLFPLLMFLFTVILIVAIRPLLIYMVAASMPIFAFFHLISVGPFKKAATIVEYIWSLGIILPALSVLGAIITALMVKFADLGVVQNHGLLGVLYFFAPLGLVLAFPMIVQSMMGPVGGAMSGMMSRFMIGFRPAVEVLGTRWSRGAIAAGGMAAPLYAVMPTKLAARVHSGLANLAEGSVGPLTPLPLAKAAAKISNRVWGDSTSVGAAKSLTAAGISAAPLGLLSALAKSGAADASNPDAASALEHVSAGVGSIAADALRNPEKMEKLREVMSAVHGERYWKGNLANALAKSVRENFETAKKLGDPGLAALAAVVSAATGANAAQKLQNLLRQKPNIADTIANSKFAKAFLAAHGVSEGDIAALDPYGDQRAFEDAAEKIASRLEPITPDVEAYNNTYAALVTGESVKDALELDLQGIDNAAGMIHLRTGGPEEEVREHVLGEAVRTYSEATGLREEEVRKLMDGARSGDENSLDRLAGAIESRKDRALKVLGNRVAGSVAEMRHVDDSEAAHRLHRFISAGGLVRTAISPEEADRFRKMQMYAIREKAMRSGWREYIGGRMSYYQRVASNLDYHRYDPYDVMDYRAIMNDWSWVRDARDWTAF